MVVYICIILFLLLQIYTFDVGSRSKGKNLMQIITFALFVLLVSFSYHIGSDTGVYENWYNYNLEPINRYNFFDTEWEPLFCGVMSLFRTFIDDFLVVRFFLVLFINFSVFHFLKKYFNGCFFTASLMYFLLYFYDINCEALRQSMAMSVLLFSWKYLLKSDWKRYWGVVLIAIGFHNSAMVALLFPFIRQVRFNKTGMIVLLTLLFMGASLALYMGDVITMLLSVNDDLFSRYQDNYGDYDIKGNMLNINGLIMTIVIKALPVYFASSLFETDKNLREYIPILWLFTAFTTISIFVPYLFRFCNLLSLFVCAALANFVISKRNCSNSISIIAKSHTLSVIFVLLAFSYNCMSFYNQGNDRTNLKSRDRWIPYVSIFNPHYVNGRY